MLFEHNDMRRYPYVNKFPFVYLHISRLSAAYKKKQKKHFGDYLIA